jgi:hypothetical protein
MLYGQAPDRYTVPNTSLLEIGLQLRRRIERREFDHPEFGVVIR